MRFRYLAYLVLLAFPCGQAVAKNPNFVFFTTPVAKDNAPAAKGNVNATIRLGYRYLTGSAGIVDKQHALQYFARAAVQHRSVSASAWLGYAALMSPGLSGAGIDGVALVRKAADAGDPVGLTLLGRLYQLGRGVPQDDNAAKELFGKAAPVFALAKTYLGEMYLNSSSPAERSKALEYFWSAAAKGETSSMVHLAVMYIRGLGVQKNLVLANKLLQNAAQMGSCVAYYQRGVLYRDGAGVPRSYRMAATLFRRAADMGYPPAQAALGMCYATGVGVEKDLAQARKWLGKAAPADKYAARRLAALSPGY